MGHPLIYNTFENSCVSMFQNTNKVLTRAQSLRVHSAFSEDLSLVSYTHISGSQPPVTPVPGDLTLSFWLSQTHLFTYTYPHIHTHTLTSFKTNKQKQSLEPSIYLSPIFVDLGLTEKLS